MPIFAKDYINHFDKIMKKNAVKQQLIEQNVIEICYRFDDGYGRYFMVTPVCFKEHDGRCYLLAASEITLSKSKLLRPWELNRRYGNLWLK